MARPTRNPLLKRLKPLILERIEHHVLHSFDHVVFKISQPCVNSGTASDYGLDQLDFFVLLGYYLENVLFLILGERYVFDTLKQVGQERFAFTGQHSIDEFLALSKYLDELLV